MNCKDCNNTGLYQPLCGPPEKCQSCLPLPFLVSLDKLYFLGPPVAHDINIMYSLTVNGLKEPLSVFYDSGRYCIIDGKKRFAALCYLKQILLPMFNRICPNNEVSIQVRVKP